MTLAQSGVEYRVHIELICCSSVAYEISRDNCNIAEVVT